MVVLVSILLCLTGFTLAMIRSDYQVAGSWFIASVGWILLALVINEHKPRK